MSKHANPATTRSNTGLAVFAGVWAVRLGGMYLSCWAALYVAERIMY